MSRRSLVAVAAALALSGCGDPQPSTTTVSVRQPIAFQHATHVGYFRSGKHREEKLRWHVELLGLDEAPDEMKAGDCNSCHDDLATKSACAGCHVPAQDAKLRKRTDVRPCVACHRGTWSADLAYIPSAKLCSACHGEKAIGTSAEEARLREYLTKGKDIPWTQVTTVAPHVRFSHKAHVRYGEMTCDRCHPDMARLTAPPTQVAVFSMTGCIACHEKSGASTDCLRCHK